VIDHHDSEQLTVGYALHALEPADEERLTEPLQTCPACEFLIADAQVVATALAANLVPALPSPELRQRILSAAAEQPRPRLPLPEEQWTRQPPRPKSIPAAESKCRPRAHGFPSAGRLPSVKGRLLAGALALVLAVVGRSRRRWPSPARARRPHPTMRSFSASSSPGRGR
jgi:hypothetical protein